MFDQSAGVEIPELPGAAVKLWRHFLGPHQADWLFQNLYRTVKWRHDEIQLFGKIYDVPRLQQWFADGGMTYTWSGIRMAPEPWLPALQRLRERLTEQTGHVFNTALANLYRDGQDTVGWHSDDEPELGDRPIIASISLGAERDFQLRHRSRKDLGTHTIPLPHGSLLLMSGETQRHWQHSVPRRKRIESPRINLTFRAIGAIRDDHDLP